MSQGVKGKAQRVSGGQGVGQLLDLLRGYVDLKNGPLGPKQLWPFFSLILKRKPFSSGQKQFLWPYFPLIRGMFEMKSGLRFSFWALEVPELKLRKRFFSSLSGGRAGGSTRGSTRSHSSNLRAKSTEV